MEENQPPAPASGGSAQMSSNPIVETAAALQSAETHPLLAEFTEAQVTVLSDAFGADAVSERMAGAGLIAASVRGVFAQLTECPLNWHQCTVFMCTSDNPKDRNRGRRLFLGSWLIVVLQLTAVLGALRNTQAVACASNNHCTVKGMYCEMFPSLEEKVQADGPAISAIQQSSRCGYCGRVSPVPVQLDVETGEVWNLPAKDEFGMTHGVHVGGGTGVHFIKSTYTKPGYEAMETWRHDWRAGDSNTYDPVGVPPSAMAANIVAIATIPRGFNWSTVEWVCAHPDAGHLATGESPQVETARSPLPSQYVKNWCEACAYPLTREVEGFWSRDRILENCFAMSGFDWTTLCLAAGFLSTVSVGENKDVQLCNIMIDRRTAADNENNVVRRWSIALKFMGGVRRWVFLPGMFVSVVALVVIQGGDALSVCLNTIAVLFLYDVDNIAYKFFLDEQLRKRMERDGKVELDNGDSRNLDVLRWIYAPGLTFAVLLATLVTSNTGDWFDGTVFPVFLWFLFLGCFNAVLQSPPSADATMAGGNVAKPKVSQKACEVAIVVGSWFAGFLCWFAMFGLANVL